MGEISTNRGEGQEPDQTQYPEYLQKMISDLEASEKIKVADWMQDEVSHQQRQKRQEIETHKNLFKERQEQNKNRKEQIEVKFGKEKLASIEGLKDSLGQSMEEHLLTAKDQEEAERIMNLWREFSTTMADQFFSAKVEDKRKYVDRAQNGLVDAISSVYPNKKFQLQEEYGTK